MLFSFEKYPNNPSWPYE